MASVIALLTEPELEHYGVPVAGAVLPIDHYLFADDGENRDEEIARTQISRGGALYLLAQGPKRELWLVAVLEAPECSQIRRGDKRDFGWYAATNTTPVIELSKLVRKLGIGPKSTIATTLEYPKILKPAAEAAVRRLFADEDAPVIEATGPSEPATDIDGPPLVRAIAHLAASRVVLAIEALLEAWRASRVPALADLIDRATRVTREYDRPLLTSRLDQSPWNTTYDNNRAAAMPQLLQNIHSGRANFSDSELLKRLEKLTALPDDPRVGIRLLEQPMLAPQSLSESYWGSMFEVTERMRDARVIPSLAELALELPGSKATTLLERAKRWSVELAPDDAVHVRAIEVELERLEQSTRGERSLVDAIAEQPDDDAARLIYADWLLQNQHPRGEYISLAIQQARGGISPASARRLAALVDVPFLFGTLDDLSTTTRRERERGIDLALTVYGSTSSLAWRAASFNPLVRALERIEMVGNVEPHREEAMAAFIRAAPRLKSIENIDRTEGDKLSKLLDKRFRCQNVTLVRVT